MLTVTPATNASNPRTAYFATTSEDGRTIKVTLLNKDFTQTVNASVSIPGVTIQTASYQTLRPTNSRYDFVADTYYANAQVADDGTFTEGLATTLSPITPDQFSITMAPMTAVVATLETSTRTMQTLKGGNWNDVTVWSGNRVPNSSDVLRVNHAVTIPANSVVYGLSVVYGAAGRLQPGVNTRLWLGQ